MGDKLNELWRIALDQHGYVTTRDAVDAGVNKVYLVQLARGAEVPVLHRVAHGVYRFAENRIPVDQWDPYMLATLWPAGRGVLCCDTALQLHELCDVNPDKIHVAVPATYRVRRDGGGPYAIHRVDLAPDQLTCLEGIRIVTPVTAIEQGIAGHTPPHLLTQAIETVRARGLVPTDGLAHLQRRLNGTT